MSYVRLVPLALFLLATFLLMVPMNKVEAQQQCGGYCAYGRTPCPSGCRCLATSGHLRVCISRKALEMVGEHPTFCVSHDDCKNNGERGFCGRYPNPNIVEHGWCFISNSQAQDFFKYLSATQFVNNLEMKSAAVSI